MYRGERLNSISHLIGAAFSLAGLVILIVFASLSGGAARIVGVTIFGTMLFLAYLFSTLYHSIAHPGAKRVLQLFDYISIYLLIAGSYTPFALYTLNGAGGWWLFGIIWGLALFGIVQDLTISRRSTLRPISLILYLLMGWLALFFLPQLRNALSTAGLAWLVAGGVCYTVGIYFFIRDVKIPRYHAVWHFFVMFGSTCHYVCILFYIALGS